jgi:hypothetical protein
MQVSTKEATDLQQSLRMCSHVAPGAHTIAILTQKNADLQAFPRREAYYTTSLHDCRYCSQTHQRFAAEALPGLRLDPIFRVLYNWLQLVERGQTVNL